MEINAFYVTKTLILDKSFSEIDFVLHDMKAKGASHVEIEHNIDSIGYAFSGFCIDKSTNEEIQEYENKFKKKKSKDDKINELLNEINKLKLEKD